MKYIVYVIGNDKGQLYKGLTTNLEKRLYYHNSGLGNWTKFRGPFRLVYEEGFASKTEALKREKFLKSGQGRELLKSKVFINGA